MDGRNEDITASLWLGGIGCATGLMALVFSIVALVSAQPNVPHTAGEPERVIAATSPEPVVSDSQPIKTTPEPEQTKQAPVPSQPAVAQPAQQTPAKIKQRNCRPVYYGMYNGWMQFSTVCD